jgi:Trk-type K+ transport system membrane component
MSLGGNHVAEGRGGKPDLPLLLALVTLLLVSFAAGAVLLGRHAHPAGNAMSLDRALFASANALTLTGFELSPTAIRNLQPRGQMILAALTAVGALSVLIGGGSLVSSFLQLGHSRGKLVLYGVALVVGISLLGGGFLMQPGEQLTRTLGMGLSAFSGSGTNFSQPWSLWDWRLHGVILPLSLLGALGLPLLIEFCEAVAFGRLLSPWSQRMLRWYGAAFLAGMAILWLIQMPRLPWQEAVVSASACSLNARPLGLHFEQLPLRDPAVAVVTMLLMLIGAAPGGTAGGLRLTTIAALLAGAQSSGAAGLRLALRWSLAYAALVLASILLLLIYEPTLSPDRAVFLAVAAFTNVGLAHDPVSATGRGLHLLTGIMLVGRLLPPVVGVWLLHRGRRELVLA